MAEKITDDYSITNLFLNKIVNVFVEKKGKFSLKLRTIRESLEDERWGIFYSIISTPFDKLEINKFFKTKSFIDLVKMIVFDFGQYDQFRYIYNLLLEQFPLLFSSEDEFKVDMKNKELTINGINITNEIWDYIVYILKLSYGEKVTKPLTFTSEEAKQFFLAQQKLEEKIQATRDKNKKDSDGSGLMKMFLSIVYAFPSFTFDYLFDQTMAQIQWLQKYAAGSVSYEVNAQAFAAGNAKKGSKLDFFIK